MANVDDPHGFRPLYNAVTGGAIPTVPVTLTSGQTVAVGDALLLSSGLAVIATSSSGAILGVAAEALTATANTTILMWPATPWNVFAAQCSGTYAASMDYSDYDIEGTTGIMEVNEDATDEKVFHILGYVKDGVNAIGANAVVFGTFPRSSYSGLEDAEA